MFTLGVTLMLEEVLPLFHVYVLAPEALSSSGVPIQAEELPLMAMVGLLCTETQLTADPVQPVVPVLDTE